MSKTTNKSSKSSKGAKTSKTSGAILALLKRPGACGGRGARTALIENFIASRGRDGATVRDVENALAAPEVVATDVVQSMTSGRVLAIRNHMMTLLSKALLKRDDATHKYSVAPPAKKSSK